MSIDTQFFTANFSGSGDLTTYTPDLGAAFTSPSADLDNGAFWSNNGSSGFTGGGLAQLILSSGQLTVDSPAGQMATVFKPGTVSPSADYALEATFTTATDDVNISPCLLLGARASTMVVSPWTDAYNYLGCSMNFFGDGTAEVYTNYASNGAADSNGIHAVSGLSGITTFILRLEVEGTTRRIKLNGSTVSTDVVVDANFIAAGTSFIGLFDQDGTAPPKTAGAIRLDSLTMWYAAVAVEGVPFNRRNDLRPRIFAPGIAR